MIHVIVVVECFQLVLIGKLFYYINASLTPRKELFYPINGSLIPRKELFYTLNGSLTPRKELFYPINGSLTPRKFVYERVFLISLYSFDTLIVNALLSGLIHTSLMVVYSDHMQDMLYILVYYNFIKN